MLNIELRSHASARGDAQPHLLFVHGGFHNAWCWDEHFLTWFGEKGWSGHALSLRGHGNSDGHASIKRWTLRDYEEDILAMVEKIDQNVILVGHSIGGVLAERCFAKLPSVSGLAMIAPSPLRPSRAVVKRVIKARPFSSILGEILRAPTLMRRAIEPFLFSDDLPPQLREKYLANLSLESPAALAEIFSRPAQAHNPDEERPVLVISGKDDWSIPHEYHEQLARQHRAEWKISPGRHDLMLDVKWEKTARAMLGWLEKNYAARPEVRETQ